MTEDNTLIETSFAAAIAMIQKAEDLPEQTKRHRICSMRQIAKALDRPLETIPARYSAVRTPMGQLHHVPLGLTAKTLMNHKSNTKAALLWLSREKNVPEHGARLNPEWERLRAKVADSVARSRLSPLMRYCSAKGVAPDGVDERIVDEFMEYRARATARPANEGARRLLARAWNESAGTTETWPALRLIEPAIKSAASPEWSAFPAGLRDDLARYLDGLTRVRRSRRGQRIRPLKPSTIENRRTLRPRAIAR